MTAANQWITLRKWEISRSMPVCQLRRWKGMVAPFEGRCDENKVLSEFNRERVGLRYSRSRSFPAVDQVSQEPVDWSGGCCR